MYLLVASYVNGDVKYHGPFPSEAVALQYGESFELSKQMGKIHTPVRWFAKPLIVPYRVKQIIWRES